MNINPSDPVQLLVLTIAINATITTLGILAATVIVNVSAAGIAASILLLLGATALASSIIFESYILAFIGLSLTFWGALLLYMKPKRYVRASLLDSTTMPLLTNIGQMIANTNVQGKPVHLPPRNLAELKSGKLFIPTRNDKNPHATRIERENDTDGIYIAPTGLGLVNLFENELGKDFNKVDLDYLKNNLPRLFIKDLEIAEDVEMTIEGNMVCVKITGSVYRSLCNEISSIPNMCSSVGCPLCSSIACALARATGKPIIIEKTGQSTDGKIIEAHYRIIEE